MTSGGFRSLLVFVSTEPLNVGLIHFDSQSLETLERRFFSKYFCMFTGVYIAIYVGPCRRSYNVRVRKFWTSKMLDK